MSLHRQSGCGQVGLAPMVFVGTLLAFLVLLLVSAMSRGAGIGAGLVTAAILTFVGVLYFRAARGAVGRPVAEILRDVDALDEQEGPEEAFQPFFDELLLHIASGSGAPLDDEIVRRMNAADTPSRRMFLQLAAVHPRLEGALRDLAESASPLAPEAKELLERRGD